MDDCFQFAVVHVSVGVLVWDCWCGNVGVGMSVRECWCGRDRVDDCVQFAFVHVSVGGVGNVGVGMSVRECWCGSVGLGMLVWECCGVLGQGLLPEVALAAVCPQERPADLLL